MSLLRSLPKDCCSCTYSCALGRPLLDVTSRNMGFSGGAEALQGKESVWPLMVSIPRVLFKEDILIFSQHATVRLKEVSGCTLTRGSERIFSHVIVMKPRSHFLCSTCACSIAIVPVRLVKHPP